MGQYIAATAAQATLRSDQLRGRNTPRGNNLCDLAGKFRRVFVVGGAARARNGIRAFPFHQ